MERQGHVPVGTLKAAKIEAKGLRFEPLKHIQALDNALRQGVGVSLDEHRMTPPQAAMRPPIGHDDDKLLHRGALILISDQEGKQKPVLYKVILSMLSYIMKPTIHIIHL